MPPKKSLADQIADLETTVQNDYDPEDITGPVHENIDSADGGDDDDDDNDAREHYVKVGKSSLRNQQQFLLDDPRYAGQRASRKDLYSSDEEEDMEEELQDDEEEESAVDLKEGDENEEFESWHGGSDDDEKLQQAIGDDVSEEESEEDEDDDDSDDEEIEEENTELNDELRKLQEDEKTMISKMSQSAQSDIEKGQHVRQQLTLWENFLESRIRTQKIVELANQLPQHETWPDYLAKEEGIEPDLDAAKDELRETIDELIDLRTNLLSDTDAVEMGEEHTWNKRKRHLDDDDEYIDKLWEDISQINDVFVPFRDSTLEKWSNKVQIASSARLNKKFKAFDQNIMTQVSNIMSDKENLVRRTQLQRSEYRVLGKKIQEAPELSPNDQESTRESRKADRHLNNYDVEIFDDNDFYQQLLRELIEARMVDTDDPIAQGMRWAARKAAESKKKKRAVDRKASKGRKLRFNVHEKLQNFMAPIPAGTWHNEMTEELYTSLLGQKKMVLDEAAA
ncbi:apoptosis antagonizing transcription factor-domain-containing protein [Zychaea mexicana]|uniref:apoptosis antagonizing transcription factor-domain-containing protein n=1 Tax=Zychaea mexicana TaxID=64656 RepID=UPI0022FEB9BE|nr:apoptosis antagonizing transcription factor-domain-containing protein [Zychaea mexicana]KAI9488755.1 apoptosis antagonizing transcription factor-domain-containing protein [Zychaea mexicana]